LLPGPPKNGRPPVTVRPRESSGDSPNASATANTGAGKQLYRSRVATPAIVTPATSRACRAASTAARLVDRSSRSSNSRSTTSAWPAGNTHSRSGTPNRRAAPTDIISTAAPWFTFSRATTYRV
jgi:hypothetical protein